MPLLNKKPFQKNVIPPGLKDNDKVFYCDVTNEIFDNYQEFAERIILCNSLVWACEETGKSGLTYSEAVECEKNAKKLLHKFPAELRRLILFLVTLTNRSALSDLTDEIFYYVRERFFVGECIEYNIHGDQWIRCQVQRVVAPTPKDLSEIKNGLKPSDKLFWPPGNAYHYDIELPTKPDGVKQATNVSAAKLRRKKSTYTRDRNHLYIKHFVSKVNGTWQLKPNVAKRYDIHRVKFEDFFVGQPPKFLKSESPKKPAAKKSVGASPSLTPKSSNKNAASTGKAKKQESIDKYLKPKVVDGASPSKRGGATNSADSKSKKLNNSNGTTKKAAEKRKSTEEILERELLEKRRKMMEHQQQLIEKKAQKQLDIQRKKDEKKKLEEFIKEWSKTREDLELEDLRELPSPVPILLNTPNEYFGEIIMLYEFFQSFCQHVNTKNFFPAGITIELIDRAISQEELAGPLCDFVHLLLVAIFRLQEEEEDEMNEPYDLFAITNFDAPNSMDSLSSSADVSEAAINWPIAFHGVPLPKLAVDATTVTEVLRLHLLSAGARVTEACSRWRAQEKGGFTANDDPAVIFRLENEHIIRLLSERNISTLSYKDKIAVLECLTNQIVMYMGLRNLIFDSVETYRLKRVELRAALGAEMRKEKELLLQKKKKPSTVSGDPNALPSNDTTKQPEESPSPVNLEAIEKSFKDVQRKKDDLQKQLDELMAENMKVQLTPLGTDRAYRRFWIFPSLPGVFVEDDEQNLPPCLPRGTPALNTALLKEKEPMSYVKKLFQKEYNKENLGTWLSFGSPKKATNGSEAKTEETSRVPLTCWGDNETCPVHARRTPDFRWSYFRTESELDALLNSLNPRGKRESRLKALLTQHREAIVKNLSKQRINLNKSIPLDGDEKDGGGMVIETRKSSRGNPTYEDAMFNYPPETGVEEVEESLLRNTILSIEERSNIGGLGVLKVFNREAWIEAIKNNSYEKSCEQLIWGPNDEPVEEAVEKDPKAAPKVKVYLNLKKFDSLNKYVDEVKQNVKDMACALLQLEQSIEVHYLKPPLGAERTRHHPSKASTTDLLKRWEASLMKCTSFAQIFVHVNTLENSIAWNRSAQNAHCRICRRRGDAQNMLLCDSCNKGHHMYCLKPKLTKVPKGDWFCHACKPVVKEPREQRVRKKVTYAGDSDDEFLDRKSNIMCLEKMELKDQGKCKICSERGNTIGCSKCQKRYHLNCLLPPLRKPPTMSWACHSCRHISAKKDEESAFMVNGHRRRTRHSLESDYSTQLPLDNATLQELLTKIMHHEDAWPFLKPVSRYEAADYLQIVKRPMDFATIRHKLNMLQYHMNNQVISDSMLVFQNCFLYNKDTSEIYQAGVRLLDYFKELCHELNFKKEFQECEGQLSKPNVDANVVVPPFTNGVLEAEEVEVRGEEEEEEGDEREEVEEEEDDEEMVVEEEEEEETDEQEEESRVPNNVEELMASEDEEEDEEIENVNCIEMNDEDGIDSPDDMENLNVSMDSSSDEDNPAKRMRTS